MFKVSASPGSPVGVEFEHTVNEVTVADSENPAATTRLVVQYHGQTQVLECDGPMAVTLERGEIKLTMPEEIKQPT
jgi:hypothetical protein